MLFAGVTIGRTVAKTCDVQDNPNLLRFCDQTVLSVPFKAQYKLSGSYQLPMHFQVSGVFASYPGVPMSATGGTWLGTTNYIVSKAIAPGLTQTSVTVPLVPPGGKSYFDRLSQLDLRMARSFRIDHLDCTGALDIFNAMNASTVFNQIQTHGSRLADRCHARPRLSFRRAGEVLTLFREAFMLRHCARGVLMVLCVAGVSLWAQSREQNRVVYWTAAELRSTETKELIPSAKAARSGIGAKTFMDLQTHKVMMSHRNQPGTPELHKGETDVFVIQRAAVSCRSAEKLSIARTTRLGRILDHWWRKHDVGWGRDHPPNVAHNKP